MRPLLATLLLAATADEQHAKHGIARLNAGGWINKEDEDTHSAMLYFHSFVPPFVSIDENATKTVSDQWRAHGDTEVRQSFARLTPFQENSAGALWSAFPFGDAAASERLSIVMTFRLSGRAQALDAGEGLALWLREGPFVSGKAFGASDRFVGAAALFDTRVNQVRLVASDSLPDDPSDREPILEAAACDVSLRKDASRDDYNHRNKSRARLVATPNRLRLLIDEANQNEWRLCADVEVPKRVAERGAAWLGAAHLGVSAATGTSRDSHDVVSVEAFADSRAHDAHLQTGWRKFLPRGTEAPLDNDRLKAIEKMVDWMSFKLDHLSHVFEHSTAAFSAQIDRGEDEFEAIVDDEHNRLMQLDDSIEASLSEDLERRVLELQLAFKTNFEDKVADPENGLDATLSEKVVPEVLQPFEDSWRRPFLVLVGAHVVFGVGVVVLMRRVRKMV